MNGEMAMCPRCSEPLIETFEVKYKEFHCLICGGWFEFLQPRGWAVTPEISARKDELLARFKAGERGPVAA